MGLYSDEDRYHKYLFRALIDRARKSARTQQEYNKVKMYDWVTHEEREYRESELFDVLKKRY